MQFLKTIVVFALVAVGMATEAAKREETCSCEGTTVYITSVPGYGGETPSVPATPVSLTSPSTVLITATSSALSSIPVVGSNTETPFVSGPSTATSTTSATVATETETTGAGSSAVGSTGTEASSEATTPPTGTITETTATPTGTASESESQSGTQPPEASNTSAPPSSAAGSRPTGVYRIGGVVGGALVAAMVI
ncbi:hypothetical protein F5B20DRAFT_429501 [Whalleya microplaca]|nr:hypothetical protein F5B20DRAFT_429501 [Whalleya microplaca]